MTYPSSETSEALRCLGEGCAKGKLVIVLGSDDGGS
jgi:hypothetical protein